MMDEYITLDYGSGGRKTSSLIEEMIVPLFENDALAELGDGAVLKSEGRIVFSTDSFVVSPYIFPGGDIGKLSVCGTVNDISVSGGQPVYLSLAAVIEEGFPADDLKQILESIRKAADEAGVQIVTGDTKVVERGKGDGIYLNTAGIGFLRTPGLSPSAIRTGDRVLVSGTMGDHGTAIMLARNPDLLAGNIESDCAPLHEMALALGELGSSLRVMRDPTRGGLATTLCEFVEKSPHGIEIDEDAVPVAPAVKSACDILGLDPLYSANEGKLIAIVSPDAADEALQIMRSHRYGQNAQIIGTVTEDHPGRVVMHTPIGGSRILTRLTGAQLPRIC